MDPKRPRPWPCLRAFARALACSALLLGCASAADSFTYLAWMSAALTASWQSAPGAEPGNPNQFALQASAASARPEE